MKEFEYEIVSPQMMAMWGYDDEQIERYTVVLSRGRIGGLKFANAHLVNNELLDNPDFLLVIDKWLMRGLERTAEGHKE